MMKVHLDHQQLHELFQTLFVTTLLAAASSYSSQKMLFRYQVLLAFYLWTKHCERTVNLYSTVSIMRYISLIYLTSGARPVPCDRHELAEFKLAVPTEGSVLCGHTEHCRLRARLPLSGGLQRDKLVLARRQLRAPPGTQRRLVLLDLQTGLLLEGRLLLCIPGMWIHFWFIGTHTSHQSLTRVLKIVYRVFVY